MSKSIKLTKDPIWTLLRKVTIPASVGSLFQTFYNLVDTWFAGRISAEAIGAIAKSFPIYFTIIAVGVGLGAATNALIGNSIGEKKERVASMYVAQSLIFAFTVPAIYLSLQATGNPIPQIGFGSKTMDGVYLLEKLNLLSVDLGFDRYTDINRTTLINVFFITGALMFGTAGLPHVIVRFFTVPKVRDARISAGWALLFISILYTTAPAVAAFAKVNLINTVSNAKYTDMPAWFTNWENTGLLEFDDKNGDGVIQYVADTQVNELTIDNDIMVLANPEIANLPPWVIGLIVAGGLAAALSTAAGLLLVISTSISHDLLKKNINPNISEKGELWAARISIAVAG